MTSTITRRELTQGQAVVLGAAAVAMVAVGGFGAWGTYSNAVSAFHRQATAAGVVAAGEGLTLILALIMLGRTMLGQASPAVVRAGMWLAPVSASCIGVAIASNAREAAVYAVTPLAMSGAAEGLGLIARSIVVYRTGVDAEVQRRNADAARQLAFHRAVADGHPDKRKREGAVRRYWRLAKYVGVGDTELGAGLVDVQRVRVREGADAALASMYGGQTDKPSASHAELPRSGSATDVLRARFAIMDPAAAIRFAHGARPDAPPAELAAILGTYGVNVDPVAVALVLEQKPAERADTPAAPTGEKIGWPSKAAEARAARLEREQERRAKRSEARQQAWEEAVGDLKRIEFSTVPTGRHGAVVYFLRNGDRVKIGTSTNLRDRVGTLSLRRTDLVLVVEGDQSIERAFHRRFDRYRVGFTEWFHLEGELARWLRSARHDLPPVPWPASTEVTIERADGSQAEGAAAVPELVMPAVAELTAAPFRWDDIDAPDGAGKVTAALPAELPRQVVTATVTITPSELRRQARRLNREAVRSTGRAVTIKTLQDELGLSRREATDLRREVTGGERS
ncbi:GIY-YIG nuclease family protein [Streptomyces sp. NPDC001634]|uniref:GIY-YIG nuclease family protein n=1 Tax=Streptomyces sp. NPDC001634 TaxID=3154390 RepID=UPI00332122D9